MATPIAHLVTFSTPNYSRSRALCVSSALQQGITQTHPVEPQMLPPNMQKRCGGQRGFGWWQWKPMAIQIAMNAREEGSTLIYADVGVEFINHVSHIIDRMDQDIFLFGNNWEHAHWCKGDVAYACWPDNYGGEAGSVASVWGRYGKQAQASVIFFRVSDYSRKFVKEWLDWCLSGVRIGAAITFGKDNAERRDERATWSEFRYLIDDSPSFFNNHPEFQEHRHDQAILTTLAYREGIKLHYWPAVYNKGGSPEFVYEKLPEYAGDSYPVLFSHHRKRNHEWEQVA